MKEHIRAELTNRLRDIAIDYHDHQSLRMFISDAIGDALHKNEEWYRIHEKKPSTARQVQQLEMKHMISGIDEEIGLDDWGMPILNGKQINAIRDERLKKAYEIPPVKHDFPEQLKDLTLIEKYDVMNWFKAKFKEEEQTIPSKGEICGIPYQIDESLPPGIEFIFKMDGKILFESQKNNQGKMETKIYAI